MIDSCFYVCLPYIQYIYIYVSFHVYLNRVEKYNVTMKKSNQDLAGSKQRKFTHEACSGKAPALGLQAVLNGNTNNKMVTKSSTEATINKGGEDPSSQSFLSSLTNDAEAKPLPLPTKLPIKLLLFLGAAPDAQRPTEQMSNWATWT